jgi:alkylation response protein AidB-like acyl-CoA dehydrogenase
MDFAFTPEQDLLRETARGLLARECPTSLLRAHIDDVHASDALWTELAGFAELGVGPVVDLCVFMEELGYVAAPARFFASAVLAAPVLGSVGADVRLATLAVAGADGEWRLNDEPRKSFVLDAETVDAVIALGGDGSVVLLDEPALRRLETIDTTRPVYDVDTAGGGTTLGRIDPAEFDRVLARATVALAAEMVGTARHLLEMTLQYAKDRHQFGVPIGSFQAIQHKLADMSVDVERAWSATYYAAMTLDAGDADRHRAVHAAKAAAGEAARRCAKDGIQIHGGIGYTWEHDLHLFMRRAFASEALLGTTGWHHDRLADVLFA